MGGGDLNTKKSWHPNTIKNQERVWKAEQAVAEEKKRILELQRERDLEHDRAQLNNMAQRNFGAGGAQAADNRLHWMYDKPDKQAHHEDYLLGKEIGKGEESEKVQNAIPAVSRRVVGSSMTKSLDDTQVDLTRKLREDPLLLVKERERAARAALLNNPLQRKRLADLLRKEKDQKESKQKESKTKKKSKKKKKNLDDMLAAKLNALGDKGIDLSSLLNSKDSSEGSNSSEDDNEKPKKKKSKKVKKKKKINRKSHDSEPDSSEDEKHRRKQDADETISIPSKQNNSSGLAKHDDRKSMKSYESHHKDHRGHDVDKNKYQRYFDNSIHQSSSRYNETRKRPSISPSHSDGETKFKKSKNDYSDRNRNDSGKYKCYDSPERRDFRRHDVDRKNYERTYDSKHQSSSRHNEPKKCPSRSSSHSDGETKYKKNKSEYRERNRNDSDKYKHYDSPERRDFRRHDVDRKNYERTYDSKHQSSSRHNEPKKRPSRSSSHSDGETKYKKNKSEYRERNRNDSDKYKHYDSPERRDKRSHDVDRKNYERSYDSNHQSSSKHNEPSRSSSHSDGETKYKKSKKEDAEWNRNESEKYKSRDSPERRDTREAFVGKKDVREKRQGMSEAERAAKLAEMAAAGRERETERGIRVARQRAEEAAVETDRGPPRALNNEARALPDSLESRIRSNRHYIQRDKTHMNQNFARR